MKRVALMAVVVALVAGLAGAAQSAALRARTIPPMIGQTAPDFALSDVNGRQHSLQDYRGQIAVLGFISTQCPVSKAYYERLNALAKEFGPRNVVLLGINSNATEPLAEVRAHAARTKLAFTVLKDEGNRVADLYHASLTPEMYVIDAAGVLRYHGRVDTAPELARVKRSDLRETLEEMLAGKPVSTPETKSFGCQLKRSQKDARATATAPASEIKIGLLKPAEFAKLRQQAQGQVLVVNFWATWCGPCVVEFPELVKLDEKYRARGVQMVAISADDAGELQSKVAPFIKEQKARFAVYVQDGGDPEEIIGTVAKEWSGALPATFVFDKQGQLSYSRLGILDREELEKAVEKALK